MVNKSLHPQEVELYYVLPALRREIAACMKADGLSQKQIAALLEVSEPAVSQYFSAKRASTVRFTKKIVDSIKSATSSIKDHKSLVEETQKLLRLARDEGVVCQVHRKLGFGKCDVEYCLCKPGVKHD